MLLTLLPLAGWAATGDVTFSAASESATYDGTEHNLPTITNVEGIGGFDAANIIDLKWYRVVGTTQTEIAKVEGAYHFTKAGTYKVTFGYNGQSVTYTGNWVVKKFDLNVFADDFDITDKTNPKYATNHAITYGDEAPAFTWYFGDLPGAFDTDEKKEAEYATITGQEGVTFNCEYQKGSDKGDYAIIPVVSGEGRLVSENYNFVPNNGTLKVVAKAITLTAADFTINVTDVEYNTHAQVGAVSVKDLALNKNLEVGAAKDFEVAYFTDEACTIPFSNGTDAEYYSKAELQAISTIFESTPTNLSGLTSDQLALLNKVCNPATPYTGTTEYAAAMKTAVDAAVTACGTSDYSDIVKAAAVASNHINAGTYYAKVIGRENYTDGGDVVKSFRITKAPLLIKTKGNATDNPGTHKSTYNGSVPTIAATNNDKYLEQQGWLEVDPFNFNVAKLKVSLTPVTGSADGNAGDYTLVVSANGVAQSALYDNYQVTFSNKGTYTIEKKALTFKLANQYISYDAENPFAIVKSSKDYLTAAVVPGTGFSVDTYPTIQAVAVDGAGEYDLVLNENAVIKQSAGAKLDKTANFAITYTGATLTVEGGTISIIPEDASFTYGDKAPAIKFDVEGMKDADKTEAFYAEVKKYISYTDGYDAGSHNQKIIVDKDGLLASDYYKTNLKSNYTNINVFKANYTIAQRALTKIEVKAQSVNTNDYVNPTGDQTGLVKSSNTVVFTAKDYTITEADYNKLKTEFVFVTTGATVDGYGKITAATDAKIGINFVGTKFTNFSLPTDVAALGTTAVADKYILGALTLSAATDIAINANATDAANIAAINGAADAYVGKKNNVTVQNRSFTTNTWAVMVLPFETTVREISQVFGYAVVDVLDTSKGDGNNIYFKLHMGKIEANQPFMVKTDALLSGDLVFEGVTTAKVAAETTPVADRDIDAGGTKFIGLYQQKELQGAKQLWLSGAGKWGYNKNNNKVPVGATRAYLQLPEESTGEARIFIEEPDGSTTAISVIAADDANVAKEGWYTLNGVKLNAAPVEKGVYINNGKKVVIK